MGVKLKVCWDCGQRKRMGKTKSRCRSCRKIAPHKVRPGGSAKTKQSKQKPQKSKKVASETYLARNIVLKELGYNSYAEYLESSLWATVRRKGWAQHGNDCKLCGEKANVLHHLSYSKAVLVGDKIGELVPLCDLCHTKVEFLEDGKKRTLLEARNAYSQLLALRKNELNEQTVNGVKR